MSENRWGFDNTAWEAAKREGKELLADYAKRRQMIPYSEFVQRITSIQIEHDDPRLAHFRTRFRLMRALPAEACLPPSSFT